MPITSPQNVSFQAKKPINPAQIQESKSVKLKRFVKNHKTAAAVIAASAVSAIVVGGLIYKGVLTPDIKIQTEGKKVLHNSELAKKEAQDALEYAQNTYNEVSALIKQGKDGKFRPLITNNGRGKGKFTRGAKTRIFEELNPQNEVIRRTSLDAQTLRPIKIEEILKGSEKKNVYFYDGQGFCYELMKGLEEYENGLSHAQLGISYTRKWPLCASVKKDCTFNSNRWVSAKEIYLFDYGELNSYTKNFNHADKTLAPKSDKEFILNDRKVSCAYYNSGTPQEKRFILDDKGKLKRDKDYTPHTAQEISISEIVNQKRGKIIYFDPREAS